MGIITTLSLQARSPMGKGTLGQVNKSGNISSKKQKNNSKNRICS